MKKVLALVMSAVMVMGTAVMAGAVQSAPTKINSGMEIVLNIPKGVIDSGVAIQVAGSLYKGTGDASNLINGKAKLIADSGADQENVIFDIDEFNITVDSGDYVGELTLEDKYKEKYDIKTLVYNATTNKFSGTLSKKSSGGGNGGGGSGGSGTASSSLVTGNTNSGLVTGNLSGSINSTTASKAAANAVAAAVKSAVASGANNADATVTLTNAGKITPAVFKSIVTAAEKAAKGLNVDVTVNADTVVGKTVMGRLYISLEEAAGLTDAVNTSIDVSATSKTNAAIVKKFDQYFVNDIAVVSFGQKGAFGMEVKAAVKVDTSKLDTAKLRFFNYNTSTNAYTEMTNTGYFVDTNGYVHFATNAGNSVVIADAPLTSK